VLEKEGMVYGTIREWVSMLLMRLVSDQVLGLNTVLEKEGRKGYGVRDN